MNANQRSYMLKGILVCFLCEMAVLAHAGNKSSDSSKDAKDTNCVAAATPDTADWQSYANHLRNARKAMERLRKKIEEWGIVSASVPITMKENAQFKDKISGTTPVDTYITNEHLGLAGGSYVTDASGVANQANVSLQRSITETSGVVKGTLLSGTPAAPSGTLPGVPDLNTSILTGTTSYLPSGSGLVTSGSTFSIPQRTAIMLGYNDAISGKLFEMMANPPWETFVNQNYEVHFAIVQVSCNPGWRTRENYIADISATADYCYVDDCNVVTMMPDKYRRHPMVFSVLPMLDAQNLELGSMDQRITELAGQLNAAYPTVGLTILGQDLITFVHRYQKSNVTHTAMTVTNSYSTGRSFGFRFAPSFVAQKDPAYKKSGAANILQATSFPVLVTFVVNKNDLADPVHPKLGLKYDQITTHITTRWLINNRPPLTQWYRRLFTPMERETYARRIDWADDVREMKYEMHWLKVHADEAYYLDKKADKVDKIDGDDPRYDGEDDPRLTMLNAEEEELEAQTNVDSILCRIFEAQDPTPPGLNSYGADVNTEDNTSPYSPNYVPVRGPFTLVIKGNNLNRVRSVIIGGKSSESVAPLFQEGDTEGGQGLLVTFDNGGQIIVSSKDQRVENHNPPIQASGSSAYINSVLSLNGSLTSGNITLANPAPTSTPLSGFLATPGNIGLSAAWLTSGTLTLSGPLTSGSGQTGMLMLSGTFSSNGDLMLTSSVLTLTGTLPSGGKMQLSGTLANDTSALNARLSISGTFATSGTSAQSPSTQTGTLTLSASLLTGIAPETTLTGSTGHYLGDASVVLITDGAAYLSSGSHSIHVVDYDSGVFPSGTSPSGTSAH